MRALAIAGLLLAVQLPGASASATNTVSISSYREHLRQLQRVVAECEQQPGKVRCAPERVGPDAVVRFKAGADGSRPVEYTWLRENAAAGGRRCR